MVPTPLALAALVCSVGALVVGPPQQPLVAASNQFPAAPNDDTQTSNEDAQSQSWWDTLRDLASQSSLSPSLPHIDELGNVLEDHKNGLAANIDEVTKSWDDLRSQVIDFVPGLVDSAAEATGGHRGRHDFPDHTIYELIKLSNHTKKFVKLIDDFPEVVKILNGTQAGNHTLFVPLDEAFDHLPPHPHKPSKDFLENAFLMHIGLGNLPAIKLLKSNTIPTAYNEVKLGHAPQRLRTSVGIGGLKLNFYSKVVAADFKAKNGIIHGIRDVLVPPPMTGAVLSSFPSEFSTLLLAFEKTNFVDYIHHVKMNGTTVFAPSNSAFRRLGPKVNAFLFNSEKGHKYLKAILKYHIVINYTLYTDAYYDKTDVRDAVSDMQTEKREHYDLVTLLHDLHVSVDILQWASLKFVTVNGFAGVKVRDGIAKNGVIHVLDRVLIPPHQHKHEEIVNEWDDHISVEELVERLSPWV